MGFKECAGFVGGLAWLWRLFSVVVVYVLAVMYGLKVTLVMLGGGECKLSCSHVHSVNSVVFQVKIYNVKGTSV